MSFEYIIYNIDMNFFSTYEQMSRYFTSHPNEVVLKNENDYFIETGDLPTNWDSLVVCGGFCGNCG